MSTRLSPDGLYYWDGQQWVSTLSHDGRTRWNGTSWVSTGQAQAPVGYQPAGPVAREPTSWTRPLQIAVAAWYALQGLYALTLPFWMSGPMSQAMDQAIRRQQQLNPASSPPPADLANAMTSFVGVALWVGAVIGVVIAAVVVIGALGRWTWIYYVVLVLLGFGAISLPLNVVNAVGGSSITAASGFSLPGWTYWLGLLTSIPGTALFVWMLIAMIKHGPWGMRRVTAALS
ncbi:MAG: hypothetical protein ACYDAL_00730 [Candidatus Dormibacteraceae bacterium]